MLLALPSPAGAITLSGSYYEDNASNYCSQLPDCIISFAPFPSSTSGQFITITEVGCIVNSSATFATAYIWITDNGQNYRRIQPLDTTRSTGWSSFRQQVNFKVSGGPPRQLLLTVSLGGVTGVISGQCTIIGTISAN